MNTQYNDILSSFVDKYGLTRGEVMAEIEKTFSSMLSRWHGQNIIVLFTEGKLKAIGYNDMNGMTSQIPIELTSMRGWNTIKRILDTNLGKAACLQEVAALKRQEREIRWGKIAKIQKDGALCVEIEIEDGKAIFADCPLNYIGLHERKRFHVGQRRAFHLRRVEPVFLKDTPRVKVIVDRVSKTLVEKLLQSHLQDSKVNIRCLNRYVGRKSFVESSAFLPKKAILATSRELNEHVQVKVVRTAPGCRF